MEEWNGLDEETKKNGLLVGGTANYGAIDGLACLYAIDAPSNVSAYIGTRLCFKTCELAQYAGRQFADLYADFYLIRK